MMWRRRACDRVLVQTGQKNSRNKPLDRGRYRSHRPSRPLDTDLTRVVEAWSAAPTSAGSMR
jgi:hypothetical protein